MKVTSALSRPIVAVVILFLAFGGFWIWSTSFVVGTERFFCLSDDQMISMRYARNLVHSGTLTWNPGSERVEGISNLLWTLLMALFHFLPLPAAKMSLLVQLAGLGFLGANIVVVERLFRELSGAPPRTAILPAALTALCYPLNYWSITGFEVSALVLLLDLAVLLEIRALRRGTPDLGPGLLLGVASLVRLDMVVLALAVTVAFPLLLAPGRRAAFLGAGTAPVVAAVVGQSLFRHGYYGDWLPNTYYLKMTGYPVLLRVTRGLFALLRFLVPVPGTLLVIAAIATVRGRNRLQAALLLVVVAPCAYSAYIGGDAWEWWGIANRFVVIGMPLLIVLFCWAAFEGWALVQSRLAGQLPAWSSRAAAMLVGAAVLLGMNSRGRPDTWADWLLLKPPFDETRENREKVELARALDASLPKGASVALYEAGAIPYFSERPYIDLLGKNDRVIARGQMRRYDGTHPVLQFNNFLGNKYTFFFPGHLKWDYGYSIGQLQPDLVMELWGPESEALPYLGNYRRVMPKGVAVYVKKRQ